MSIPELSIISDFEAGVNCLQNPSLLSRFFSLSGIQQLPQVYIFWKWGALLLALVATFTGVITRIKLLAVRIWKAKCFASSGPPAQQIVADEDEDFSCSSASSDDEVCRPTTSFQDREPMDEDFCVAGSRFCRNDRSRELRLRRRRSGGDRFSWSDFVGGKSVVKLWDSVGLALDFEDESSGSVVSLWDLNRDQKLNSFSGIGRQIPVGSSSSPAAILSAGLNNKENILLSLYDTRVGLQIPAVFAEWRQRWLGKVVTDAGSGAVEKVYVSDGVTSESVVGDLRKMTSPLENLTESDAGTWW